MRKKKIVVVIGVRVGSEDTVDGGEVIEFAGA
jgi:hypothetical protein